MNHLSEKNSVLNRPMYLCLCPVCLGQFLDTGIYKIMREDTIDLDALSPLLTEYNCQYLILNKSVPYTGDPQKNGLTKIADIEAYELYRNEAVEIAKKKTALVTCGNPVA